MNDVVNQMKILNKTVIPYNSTLKYDRSVETGLPYVTDIYKQLAKQLQNALDIENEKKEVNNIINELNSLTSTSLEPGWEKYYDNSFETTTTPYPEFINGESESDYIKKKKVYYKHALEQAREESKKIKKAEEYWSDDIYFA